MVKCTHLFAQIEPLIFQRAERTCSPYPPILLCILISISMCPMITHRVTIELPLDELFNAPENYSNDEKLLVLKCPELISAVASYNPTFVL